MEEKRGDVENKCNDFLKAISEESVQLNKFLQEEKKLVSELCSFLTKILKNLKISFNIPTDYVRNFGSVKQIKLDMEGRLVIFKEDGKVDSRPLGSYRTDIILEVMWLILPELEKAMREYRKEIGKRVALLGKVNQELEVIQKAFSSSDKESHEQLQDERTMRPLVASKNY